MRIPTKEEYAALFKTSKVMQTKGAEFLKAHFTHRDKALTAEELAKLVGEKYFQATNAIYGKCFAMPLADEFGWSREEMKKKDFVWLRFLTTYEKVDGKWRFTLRDEVVEALKSIGWKKALCIFSISLDDYFFHNQSMYL